MNQRIGNYVTRNLKGELYKAYIPAKLPFKPDLNMSILYPHLLKASSNLAILNSKVKLIPNMSLFIYMYVRKEALLSSQIEGTQSSFSDLILFENNQKYAISKEDVEEVSNYVAAVNYGLDRLKHGFPLSLRLLKEIHEILLSGTRGSSRFPGEFRKSQNWIGGIKPSVALFVPPPIEFLDECLHNFEIFIHNNSIIPLIKAGIAHVQFETIHPFLDGNGRLGRLLVILIFYNSKILDNPILYLSLYLKRNRDIYYNLLQKVRTEGNWEVWLQFFLEGIIDTTQQASDSIDKINSLFENDMKKISTLGRMKDSCFKIFEYLKKLPQISVPVLAKELNISAPTARNSLNNMVKIGIFEEISGKQRDKIYVYKNYLDILEQDTNPI